MKIKRKNANKLHILNNKKNKKNETTARTIIHKGKVFDIIKAGEFVWSSSDDGKLLVWNITQSNCFVIFNNYLSKAFTRLFVSGNFICGRTSNTLCVYKFKTRTLISDKLVR